MAFGKRMREKRTHGAFTLVALAATVGLGAASLPAQQVGNASPQPSVSREFVAAQPTKRKASSPTVNRAKPRSRTGWDSRKARRRLLMEIVRRPNTGRQWVRIRRILRTSDYAHLLHTEAWKLQEIVTQYYLAVA